MSTSQKLAQNFCKLVSFLFLGLLIGCSNGGSDNSSETIVVDPVSRPETDDSTADANADIGNTTGLDTAGQTSDAGNTTTSGGDTTAAGATSGNSADAGSTTTDAGVTTAGTATSGVAANDGGETAGTASAGGTDAVDTTDGTATIGTTDGTTTDTDGVTAGTTTDAGVESDGMTTTDSGVTAGTTDAGTTAGTDTDGGGQGTTTSGQTVYEVGSLAYLLQNQADLSSALAALQEANIDEAINFPENIWTIFLPTDEAFEALDSPSDFDLDKHMTSGLPLSIATLAIFDGETLIMNDGGRVAIDGVGTPEDPLTIANARVIRPDITGNTGLTIVHVIDAVIGEDIISNPYPEGSLADVLFQRGDMTNALQALQVAGLDEGLNVPMNQWTLFLPNDSAFDDQIEFNVLGHINENVSFRSDALEGLVGTSMAMTSGDVFVFGGGGTEPLTIGDATIDEPDVQPIANRGPVVHIIDRILVAQ